MASGHGGHCAGWSLVDVNDEKGPWWPVYMYTISLGGVVMCMGTNMYMNVLVIVIDLLIQTLVVYVKLCSMLFV